MSRIAIVGAGPAGSCAGWHLVSRGHAITLIDRADFPRPKTCGDWIPLAAVAEVEAMGINRESLERLATERAHIERTVLVSPDGRSSRQAARDRAYVIPRLAFDAILRRAAVNAGCAPVRRTVRTILEADGAFLNDYDFVIDARGTHAGTPNAVALRAYWSVPHECIGDGDDRAVQIHADRAFRRGYGWIFPVHTTDGGVRFNVGAGLWGEDNAAGRSIADFYARFVETNHVLQRWKDASRVERAVGCHVGLARWTQTVSGAGALRIGDAANLADPLTGDGIGNAMKSGRLVADAIDHGGNAREAAARWQQLHDREFQPEFRAALAIRRVLSSSAGKNAASRLLAAAPSLRARVHGALFAERTYRGVLDIE